MTIAPSLWVPFADEMLRRIVSGDYGEGSTLPTESQLGDEFGISRTVIREGIKVLVEKGLIWIDRGRGTRVLSSGHWRALDSDVLAARLEYGDQHRTLADILVLRKGIEPELAALAAARADDAALARLGSRIEALGSLRPISNHTHEYMRADGAFHDCIAEISQAALARAVIGLLVRPFAMQRILTSHIPGAEQKTHEQHLAIFRCVHQRDPEGARAAMRQHLEWAEERLDYATTRRNSFNLTRIQEAPLSAHAVAQDHVEVGTKFVPKLG